MTLAGPRVRVAFVAMLVTATPAVVQAQNQWERQVQDRLQRALAAVSASDVEPRAVTRTGLLNGEESEFFTVTLLGGVSYSILGVCDNDCVRLQLMLTTTANNELALDRSSESFPMLQFTPTETRQYRIRVVMEACQMNPCWYAVGIAPAGQRRTRRG